MKRNALRLAAVTMAALIVSTSARGQTYSIGWSSFSGGSEVSISRDRRALSVAGESFVGRIQSPPFVVQSGFLANPLVRGPVVSVGEDEGLPLTFDLSQNYSQPVQPCNTYQVSDSQCRICVAHGV